MASGEWAEAAEELAAALGLEVRWEASRRRSAGVFRLGLLLHALRPEATRLFVGAPEPAVSPYEGVWRAADDGVQALLFVNPHSMEVERFMRACGLGRPEGTNEPLDHVATECELMEHLTLRAAGAEPPEGAPAGADLPGGSPEAAYGAFLEGHARTWMPRFAERVAAESRTPLLPRRGRVAGGARRVAKADCLAIASILVHMVASLLPGITTCFSWS